VVTSARETTTGALVAIKFLSDDVYRASGFAQRYRDEITVLDRIEHPHVAQVFEFVESEGSAAVVTELISGTTVRQILDSYGALDPESALYVLKGALLGLGEAHGRFIVHRDVKPENVFVDTSGTIKVVDIGIAAPYKRNATTVGTPRYLAPELFAGEAATPPSDVFAATAVLYECLTGKPPKASNGKYLGLAGRPADDVILAIRGGTLPQPVRTLMSRGLNPLPQRRPADADRMVDELEQAAVEAYGLDWEAVGKAKLAFRMSQPRLAAAGAADDAAVRHPSRNRILLGAILVALLGAGTAFALTGPFSRDDDPASAPVYSHVPVPTAGPTVPAVTSLGTRKDTVKPQAPTGLQMTSRSQTAVSLDWDPAFDNVKVAGYVVLRNGRQVGTSFEPGFTDTGLTPQTVYSYTVTAFDAAGNVSAPSAALPVTTLKAPDITAPSVPAGLHSTGRSVTSVVLAWTASHDDVGVAGYDVVRDGTVVGSTTRTTFTDTGLAGSSTHTYVVRAFDTSNNASLNSNQISVTTLAAPDTAAPSVPTGVSASATGQTTINITWSAAQDNVGVTGYLVYRNGVLLTTTAGTGFGDAGLAPDTTYSYTVRAVDAANNTSGFSAAAVAHTDGPPPPPPPPSPTDTPTPTTPPPPPPATVVDLSLSSTPITQPDCTTEVDATVDVANGPLTVTFDYTINGVPGTTTRDLAEGPNSVPLSIGTDGTVDGSASVSVEGYGGGPASTSWTAPAECITPPTSP
jgi:chitodextrinase